MASDMTKLNDLFGLSGKVAVVTGAASGIGLGIATLFAEAGADVAAADINEDGVKAFAGAAPGNAVALKLDQGDREAIRAVFAAVDQRFGRLDVLVNCAGIYPAVPFEQVTPELLTKVMTVNANGYFHCAQEAVALMKRGGGGSIVNISSVNSDARGGCVFEYAHYVASKAAINGMTTGLALQYAEHGIRVNAVMPGVIVTSNAAVSMEEFAMKGPLLVPGRIPLKGQGPGGMGAPVDIAAMCLYFASEASRYVTGQILAVDGGFLIS